MKWFAFLFADKTFQLHNFQDEQEARLYAILLKERDPSFVLWRSLDYEFLEGGK